MRRMRGGEGGEERGVGEEKEGRKEKEGRRVAHVKNSSKDCTTSSASSWGSRPVTLPTLGGGR